MTNEFMREDRYIVFKVSDLGNSLKGDEIRQLEREYAEQRRLKGKEPLECVVVEKDWPEYEPTWKAIEARVTGAQPAPTIAEQDQINAEAAIRSIYDARLSDEALWQTIANGMITPAHIAQPAPSVPDGVAEALQRLIENGAVLGPASSEDALLVARYRQRLLACAPSVPNGWLRAIDEALVVAHIGVANAEDTYEQAKAKLDNLIGFHVDIATDPAVNGGWKLVPNVPEGFSREDLEAVAGGLDGYEKTVNVGNATGEGDGHLESTTAYAARFIRAMLAATEAKP